MSEAKEKTTKSSGLKKFLMHQTAGTKAGRKLISSFVGENGNEIIEAVKTITAKVEDKETAKKNKEVHERISPVYSTNGQQPYPSESSASP
eukprot:1394099-Amorphochlora_amoeboformis.AAC.1